MGDFMCCRLVEMREKQVVCIKDGTILGLVGDVEIDSCSGKLINIIVCGKRRLFGRDDDFRIPWDCIEVFGEDSILVKFDNFPIRQKRKGFLSDLFFQNRG